MVEKDGFQSVQRGGYSLDASSGHLGTSELGFSDLSHFVEHGKVPLVYLGTSKCFFWNSVYVEDEDGTMDREQDLHDIKGI